MDASPSALTSARVTNAYVADARPAATRRSFVLATK
jgi:hypothetical protein